MAIAALLPLAVPDPGAGVAPPGSQNFLEILNWVAWAAFVVCVAGVLFAGIGMAVARQRGEGGERVAQLGWALGACVVVGSASGFVAALVA